MDVDVGMEDGGEGLSLEYEEKGGGSGGTNERWIGEMWRWEVKDVRFNEGEGKGVEGLMRGG